MITLAVEGSVLVGLWTVGFLADIEPQSDHDIQKWVYQQFTLEPDSLWRLRIIVVRSVVVE